MIDDAQNAQPEQEIPEAVVHAMQAALESRQLIGFLARLLLQQHDGHAILNVVTEVPPLKFKWAMVAPGEVHVQLIDPETQEPLVPQPAAIAKIITPAQFKGRRPG
jgi:hypothetical protein